MSNKDNLEEIKRLLSIIITNPLDSPKQFTTELIGINGRIETLDDSFKFKQNLLEIVSSLKLIDEIDKFRFQASNVIRRVDEEIILL